MYQYPDTNYDVSDVEIESYFNKSFTFSQPKIRELPKVSSLFVEPPFYFENLQNYKAELNFVKSKLNDFDICEWHQHTRKRSPGKLSKICIS